MPIRTCRFYQYLGEPPTHPDRALAKAYHIDVMTLQDRGGPPAEACAVCLGEGRTVSVLAGGALADCLRCLGTGSIAPIPWTRSERRVLAELEKRWRHRYLGYDKRWLLRGTHAGRLPRELEREISTARERRKHPEWEDPKI